MPHLLLEELPLLGQRPGEQDLPQCVRRGAGDEPARLKLRGKDVAPPAAADQDLAPAVAGTFEEQHPPAPAYSEDRGRQPSGSGTHDHNRQTGPHGRSG